MSEQRSHTRIEAEVLRIARSGIRLIEANHKDSHFCVGSAWASLSMILQELGDKPPTAPWNKSDEDVAK